MAQSPIPPTGATASQTTICQGLSVTLSYTGGSGDTFRWYSASCGGTLVGEGNSLLVMPASTTTYYGRWETATEQSTCATVTVTVIPNPTPPASVNATQTTFCSGASTILSYTGGSGDTFNWYSGSCGGALVGTGNNLLLSPTVTTTYYGQWTNACGSSMCSPITITVNPTPVTPSSVWASLTSVCAGGSTILSYSGGSGDTFNWYSGSCGGTLVGTGNNLTVIPSGNTTYYGQWSNSCGSSACASVSVTVDPLPTAPSSANASQTTICEGDFSILSYSGGSGATFSWYTGSCGGTLVGTGNNLYVYPTTNTTYYGQWETGCGSSGCASVTVMVNPLPEAPISVNASPTTLCDGGSSTLSYNGGSGDTFYWYSGNCGATLVGTGNNVTVTPSVTTTYYGRWTNGCGSSVCEIVTIYVDAVPTPPSSVSATQTTICVGGYSTLNYVGGSGDTFTWYSGSCGGTIVGTGNNLTVYPTTTTTYYGQWETVCGNSTCVSVTVTVTPGAIPPISVTASQTTICEGPSVTLSYSGGTGSTFNWYTNACGGTLVGTGNGVTVTPAVTTTYYGRWENNCGSSVCATVTVTVNHIPEAPTSILASRTSICAGDNVTLTGVGGSGESFIWYTGSCGGAQIGGGTTWIATPSETTTYYGQWVTPCGSSACASVTVEVGNFPQLPSIVTASQTQVCEGESTTLMYTGGDGEVFTWYAHACGANIVGTGNNVVVTPTITTTYYGNWQSDCGIGACMQVTVYVSSFPIPATGVSATRTNLCYGESTTLRYTGGSGDTFWWYEDACGGTIAGTGNNAFVSPTTTTTYYGMWESGCGVTACDTVTVFVTPFVEPPSGLSATRTDICEGDSVILSYYGGSGTTFNWYSNFCRGTLVDTGNNITVKPTTYTTYYGSWENSCFESDCNYISINVGAHPSPPESVSAQQTSVCQGEGTSLRYTGGSGDTFFWLSGSCEGSIVGTGNYLTIYPSETTTYYGLWETDCGRSVCDTVTIEVVPYAEPPNSVSATHLTICKGEYTKLRYAGGFGETFVWYEDNCRGNRVGEGWEFQINPSETTTYYGAWENDCYHSDCEYVTIVVETDCDPNPNSGISLPEMNGLNIYPNPTTDQLFIASPENSYKDIELSLIDITGKVTYNMSYEQFGAGIQYSIDLSALPPGMYFLKIGNSEVLNYEKIVKQ